MAESISGWLFEAGIGENRAALVHHGTLIQLRIERGHLASRYGAVVDAKFISQWVSGKSGIVALPGGEEALLQPLPDGLTEGGMVRVEIVRESLHEPGDRTKRAKARALSKDSGPRNGITLLEELEASGKPVIHLHPHGDDLLAENGWYEALDEAGSGRVDFEGGQLLVTATPAMTVIDIDGPIPPLELAKRAAKHVALAIVRLDIGGNIGVDFPSLEAKAERAAVAAIFDDHMTADCERTAINGFGFMQIIRRKIRPSILEITQSGAVTGAALDLLRKAERDRGIGPMTLMVHPAIQTTLNKHGDWLTGLARRTGRAVTIESSGHVPIHGSQIVTGDD